MNLKEEIGKYLVTHQTVNIVIAGITCSGKTTLANQLRDYFSNKYSVTIISQDDYFKNLADIPRIYEGYLGDSIDAFHVEEFKYDVEILLKKGVAIMPKYEIETNTRISKNKIVRRSTINIIEGLHTIHILNGLNNCITIYLDTDIGTCLRRRIKRDFNRFEIPRSSTIRYWSDCILPISERCILPQKELANIVINNEGGEFDDFQRT